MVRSIDAVEKRVQRELEKQEKRHAKERAKEKPKRAISAAQILSRFADMTVSLARPQLLFSLTWCLDEKEKLELQNLIDAATQNREGLQEPPLSMPMPVGPIRSKRKRPISAKQINERFQEIRSNRAKLVFDMSKCLSRREKQTLQSLIDSAFRASAMGSFSNESAPT
jgi:hypothetical protein